MRLLCYALKQILILKSWLFLSNLKTGLFNYIFKTPKVQYKVIYELVSVSNFEKQI